MQNLETSIARHGYVRFPWNILHIFVQRGAFASYNVDSELCIQVSIELKIMISQKHLKYMWVRPNFWTRQQMHLGPHRVIRFPDARRMNVSNKTMLWVGGEKTAFMKQKHNLFTTVYIKLSHAIRISPSRNYMSFKS